ncbi:MAG: hypothetical protein ACK47E_16650 [Cyclobacteriaceae bacterium]|jgi:hypothetical protein
MRRNMSIALMLLAGLAITACPGPYQGPGITYRIFIYYKNGKGENLFDPATSGHFERSKVKLNGDNSGFTIDSVRYNSKMPKGFALSFIPSRGANGKSALDIISINDAIEDTLSSKYSGEILISCTYNGVNVLPSPMTSPLFPIVIVK